MGDLLILTAPPSSGKTYFIGKYWRQWAQIVVFMAPLRAICEEVYSKLADDTSENQEVYMITSRSDAIELAKKRPKKALIITGFESFYYHHKEFQNLLAPPDVLFILDEFHLIDLWGQSFRPLLMETFVQISLEKSSILALSASINDNVKEWLEVGVSQGVRRIKWVNCGNMTFKNPPLIRLLLPAPLFFIAFHVMIFYSLFSQKAVLMFCRYKKEVESLGKTYRVFVKVLTCVGGQTKRFIQLLSRSSPQLIIATSCLGHGVNLPSLVAVFINYYESHPDLRLQMLSRGGRKGERFITFEKLCYGHIKEKMMKWRGEDKSFRHSYF